ncbi:transcriptional regulator CadC [Vibrio anguillarum]|uniref:lysine decarboxylation/transport transcriptional activator CadC n=1 Tax=unclassified Vibrio TaxID=2614977 RepID=UPI000B8E75C1|nr:MULTISPECIES: lysine decarboxylation/transport transcriptional activator CadC [unclassified Vibrio]MBF4246407.1 transcriptional regulator CadC [Vibrio anguillarum]NAW97566.1 CadC family transcriptional regulator [Vibrio sp. V23_P3S9T160]OXX40963.1 transcriptional regulator CadC [Vibrio sp. V11_P1A41T118]
MIGIHFQINDWMLSVDENKLYRQDREVSVEPRLINLLYFLAKNAGEVFCREELIEHVWGGAIVTDQVVTQSIFELRKLLRDGREENIHYLTTVPKRGYKLVASVTEVLPEQVVDQNWLVINDEPISKSALRSEIEETAEPELSCDIAFPAGPLTRAFSSRNTSTPRDTMQIRRWKLMAFDVLWIGALIIAFGLFTYHQSETNITQAMDTHLMEFKFQENFAQDQSNIELSDGLVQKLAADIAQVSQYRVRLSKTRFAAGILAGKTVTVQVKDQGGKAYLDVEYRNNGSGTILFSRQYSLALSQIKVVMKQASQDLMQALAVPDAASKAERLMTDMPANQQALVKLIQAHHYLNVSQPSSFKEGIRLLEEVLKIEPDNAYVQAELLVAYYVQTALDPSQVLSIDRVNQLTQSLLHAIEQGQPLQQPRIFEALALHETMRDNASQANHYLQQVLAERESVLAYVLLGKLAELQGDMERASEAYSEAFYIDTSMETYMLCENLAFYSNLKSIDYALYRAVHPSVTTVL